MEEELLKGFEGTQEWYDRPSSAINSTQCLLGGTNI